jgi:hypothetical protein
MSRSRFTQLSIEAMAAEIGGDHTRAAALRRAQNGEGMSQHHDTSLKNAVTELSRWIGPAITELQVFTREIAEVEGRGGKVPDAYLKANRKAILGRITYGDQQAREAFRAAATDALADATKIRAAHEAGRDPQARIADEMERARLIGSTVRADDLVAQAEAMLRADQPRRAEFLLAVARDKGAKMTDELGRAIEDALDTAEPERKAARSIEESVRTYSDAYHALRLEVLARGGVGVRDDGTIGEGRPSEVAHASLYAKAAALRTGADAPDINSVPTGGYVRSKPDVS